MEVRALISNSQNRPIVQQSNQRKASINEKKIQAPKQAVDQSLFTQFDNEHVSMSLNQARKLQPIQLDANNYQMNIQIESSASKYQNSLRVIDDTQNQQVHPDIINVHRVSAIDIMEHEQLGMNLQPPVYETRNHSQNNKGSYSLTQSNFQKGSQQQRQNNHSFALSDKSQMNRTIFAPYSRLKQSKLQYDNQHSLYLTKKQLTISAMNQPNHFLNSIATSNHFHQQKQKVEKTKEDIQLENSIQINKLQAKKATYSKYQIQNQSIEMEQSQHIQNIKIDKSINQIQRNDSELKDTIPSSRLQQQHDNSQNKIIELTNIKITSPTKRIELDLDQITKIKAAEGSLKHNSIQSVEQNFQSDMQSPHSNQERDSIPLGPKGLDRTQRSNYLNSQRQKRSQTNKNNSKSLFQDSQINKNIISQSTYINKPSLQNNQFNQQEYREGHSKNESFYQSKQHQNPSSYIQSVEKLKPKHQKRSQNSSQDFNFLLDVMPLDTQHNQKITNQSYLQKQRTVVVQNRSMKQSIELNQADLRKLNQDFYHIMVNSNIPQYDSSRQQYQNLPIIIPVENLLESNSQLLNIPDQSQYALKQVNSNDIINSSASNYLSSVHNQQLLPVNQNLKTQILASISHTPPNWEAVYSQHNNNHQQIIHNRIQESHNSVTNQQYSNLQNHLEGQKTQKLIRSNDGKVQQLDPNKQISQSSNNPANFSKLDQSAAIDNFNSRIASDYQQVFSPQINLVQNNKIRAQSLSSQNTKILKSEINTNAIQSGDYSYLKHDLNGGAILNQRHLQNKEGDPSMKELCVGTDELEYLIANDQIMSNITSALNSIQNVNVETYNQAQQVMIPFDHISQLGYNTQSFEHPQQQLNVTSTNNKHQGLSMKKSKKVEEPENGRLIIKNIMGKNKVVYLMPNGNSVDADLINEQRQDSLVIQGDQIMPIQIAKQTFTKIKDGFKHLNEEQSPERKFKDAFVSGDQSVQGGSFKKERLSNHKYQINSEEKSAINIQHERENSYRQESLRTFNPYESEQGASINSNAIARLHPQLINDMLPKLQDDGSPSRFIVGEQNLPTDQLCHNETTVTQQDHFNQSEMSQKNVTMPQVHIKSNNQSPQKSLDQIQVESQPYQHPQFMNQNLRSVPRVSSRTKTSHSQLRMVQFMKNKELQQSQREEQNSVDMINTLRQNNNDLDSPLGIIGGTYLHMRQFTNASGRHHQNVLSSGETQYLANNSSFLQTGSKYFQSHSPITHKHRVIIQQQNHIEKQKKGLIYKISQQFQNAGSDFPNRKSSLEKIEQSLDQKRKKKDLRKQYTDQSQMNQTSDKQFISQFQNAKSLTQQDFLTKSNKTILSKRNSLKDESSLMHIKDDSLDSNLQSRNNYKDLNLTKPQLNHSFVQSNHAQALKYDQMRKTAGTINGFMISSKNQGTIKALERKIFHRERMINNADKSILEMKGYPFIIPSQSAYSQQLIQREQDVAIDQVNSSDYQESLYHQFIHKTSDTSHQTNNKFFKAKINSKGDYYNSFYLPNTNQTNLTQDSIQEKQFKTQIGFQKQHQNTTSNYYQQNNSEGFKEIIGKIRNSQSIDGARSIKSTLKKSSLLHKGSIVAQFNQFEKLQMQKNSNQQIDKAQENVNSSQQGRRISNSGAINLPMTTKQNFNKNAQAFKELQNNPKSASSIQKKARRNLTLIINQNKSKADGIILI